jgi:hypothetical protein
VDVLNERHHKKPVGASLLAKAAHQATFLSADTPLSRASSLPQGFGLYEAFVTGAKTCASDGGASGNIFVA